MPRPTYSADQIARFFLAITDPDNNDVSNLKLQKLCYYAQGVCSAARGERLIADEMEAWDHGPVFPSVYHAYKHNKSAPIMEFENLNFEEIEEADRRALTDIHTYYGQFSAWRLREMTHEERPWINAYNSIGRKMPVEAVVEFFAPQIEEQYKEKIYG